MEKIRNLSLRKTIILYMVISLVCTFLLSAVVMRNAKLTQNEIWWRYADEVKYFEMANGKYRDFMAGAP
ncbi:MAG: sensor histidine kinase, partial [Lachnospiraceae bacterium]|nr:sensor histidine kinase [Lachnospiraceae bacterium]